MTRPERHRFVVLKPTWRDTAVLGPCLMEGEPALLKWIDEGRPLVVASSHSDDETSTVRLGLSTPKKQRYGIRVSIDAIDRVVPPVALEEAARWAPSSWATQIASVLKLRDRYGFFLSVFGSLAWSHVSGETHLREGSDLDLLVSDFANETALEVVSALVGLCEHPRIDGELLFPNGAGVNLRELSGKPERVLIKAHGGPRLVRLSEMIPVTEMLA